MAEQSRDERIAAGRIKHGVGPSEDFPGNVCHLVSPIVGRMRRRQRDGKPFDDLSHTIDRLSLVLDMANDEAERATAPTPERGDASSELAAEIAAWDFNHGRVRDVPKVYLDERWHYQCRCGFTSLRHADHDAHRYAELERIFADRLAAVQAERDEARAEAVEWSIKAGRLSAQTPMTSGPHATA